MNPPPRKPCQATEGRQMNARLETLKKLCQAPRLWLGNRRVTLNEFRTPHRKLFEEKQKVIDMGECDI